MKFRACEIIQEIYDSEISFSISAPLWDAGFDWRLERALIEVIDGGNEPTFERAVEALARSVCENYPDSDFAKKHAALCEAQE